MAQQFDNTDRGGLWPRDKKGPNHPDMGGELQLSEKTVRYLVECMKAGKDAKIEVSTWRKKGRDGRDFLSCQVQIPYAERKAQPQQAQPQQAQPAPPAPQENRTQSYGESIQGEAPWDTGGDPLPPAPKNPWD